MANRFDEPYAMYEDDKFTHYRTSARDSDNRVVFGSGLTPEQAIEDCRNNLGKNNAFLDLPSREQLSRLLEKKDLSEFEMNRAIHIMGRMLLDQPKTKS